MLPLLATAGLPPVRVLVVDDSAYMRHIIGQQLSAAPGLAVVGTASDGLEALRLIAELNPDVVTLDVEMPRLGGLETLQEIMARMPRPVIMFSSFTAHGATETVQALLAGAVDFIQKPALRANVAAVMEEVAAKIRLAARARVRRVPRSALASAPTKIEKAEPRQRIPRKVVVIGASTGGPRALTTVLSMLSADLPAAYLLVQHMPEGFTRPLAERLDRLSALTVREARAGDELVAGQALLAPGGFHLTLDAAGRVALNRSATLHGVRPAVDVTLAAVARQHGAQAVGVVLTGMGQDGARGASLIHSAGGWVIAEAEESSVVWGMPRSVVEAGAADVVAPLPKIAAEIRRAVKETEER